MEKFKVEVRQTVEVTVDRSKFTPEFMAEFQATMYSFKTVEEHAVHLAQLYARGVYGEESFIEGYGQAKDFGIRFKIVNGDEELLAA